MWASRYFNPRYWAGRYFPKIGGIITTFTGYKLVSVNINTTHTANINTTAAENINTTYTAEQEE